MSLISTWYGNQISCGTVTVAAFKPLDCPTPIRNALKEKAVSDEAADSWLKEAFRSGNPHGFFENLLGEDFMNNIVTANNTSWRSHVEMLAAWQEAATNGISKTINLNSEAKIEEVEKAYRLAWETKCKCVTIYRDGSVITKSCLPKKQ